MAVRQPVVSEQDLVARCLERDEAAWRLLFSLFQPRLLDDCARLLATAPQDSLQPDELAALVWAALAEPRHVRLRAFDPARGRLGVFLRASARHQLQLVRRLRRRQPPFLPLVADPPDDGRGALLPLRALVEDFEPALSPQLRRFFRVHFLGRPDATLPPLSPVNARKLKERVLKKLDDFLADR